MCRLWFGLSSVLPFQQFGKWMRSSSAWSTLHCGSTEKRSLPPIPPQLQAPTIFDCAFFASALPVTIFRPSGSDSTRWYVCLM